MMEYEYAAVLRDEIIRLRTEADKNHDEKNRTPAGRVPHGRAGQAVQDRLLQPQLLRPLRVGEAAMNALLPSVLLRGSKKRHPSAPLLTGWTICTAHPSARWCAKRRGSAYGIICRLPGRSIRGRDSFLQLLDFVSELLFCPQMENSAFLPQLVQQERQNLQNAMQSVLDDKGAYCERQMLRSMCRGERYACGRLGEPEELDAIDARTLWTHYESLLASSRVELFYLGSQSADEIAVQLRPLLAQLPRAACVMASTVPGPQPQTLRRFSETMPLAQSRFSMGFRTDVTLQSAQYPAMLLLNAMLGGGEQNRLYTVVRGQLALCYEAGSWYDGHKGILAASAGCGRADLTAVEQEILRQLAELAEGRFSQAELEIARAGLLSDLRLLCDSPGRLDEFYTGRAAAGILQSPAELAAAVRAVPAEDICAAARQVRPDTVYTLEEA